LRKANRILREVSTSGSNTSIDRSYYHPYFAPVVKRFTSEAVLAGRDENVCSCSGDVDLAAKDISRMLLSPRKVCAPSLAQQLYAYGPNKVIDMCSSAVSQLRMKVFHARRQPVPEQQ
jgi:hypothetical protein